MDTKKISIQKEPDKMKLLSVSFADHDNNICYFDGHKVHYSKLERKNYRKHSRYENFDVLRKDVLETFGVDFDEMDQIVFDGENNASNYFFGDASYDNDLIRIRRGEINFLEFTDYFRQKYNIKCKNIYFLSHHYAHSLSYWPLLDREPDVRFVIDGRGDTIKTSSVYRGDKIADLNTFFRKEEYSQITDITSKNCSIGDNMITAAKLLKVQSNSINDFAGKLMGLQSYGNVDYEFLHKLRKYNIKYVDKIFDEGLWFSYKKDELVGELTLLDWIKTVHERIGEVIIDFFEKNANKEEIIFYSGGCALNIVWNTKLKEKFPNLIIAPHCNDEGLSFGGLEWLRIKNNLPYFNIDKFPFIQSDISPSSEPSIETIKMAARQLSEGKIIAWYQGNGEVGPRALGNRSILMDPRIVNGKEKINRIKKRENYRPFGASVLEEYCQEYFHCTFKDEYMLYSFRPKKQKMDSITHIDNTCRVQTLSYNSNTSLRKLLECFHEITECPVLLNTSLNLAGAPLASAPDIAFEMFETSELDSLFVGDAYYTK